jgi:hypothetical protein
MLYTAHPVVYHDATVTSWLPAGNAWLLWVTCVVVPVNGLLCNILMLFCSVVVQSVLILLQTGNMPLARGRLHM